MPLDGVAVDTDADGRIRLGGPVVFDGYQGDPTLTAQVLQDGWFVTQDVGRVDEDGTLHVLGRVDDVLVSGGLNVPAGAVAGRLREHPGVREAEVVGVPARRVGPGGRGGGVARPGTSPSTSCATGSRPRTRAPGRHGASYPSATLPLLPNGKVDRLAVERLARG